MASFALFLACAAISFAQPAASATPAFSAQAASSVPSTDGLDLLTRVAKRYADAKSYIIESVEERTSIGELRHYWNKTLLTAAEAPGDRSYYKGRTETGGAIKVSDGKTVWKYRIEGHQYTAQPRSNQIPKGMVAMQEIGLMNAENLRTNLAYIAKPFKSAERLPDETLIWSGQPILCQVVEVRSVDEKRQNPNHDFNRQIWIDAANGTVLKTVEHGHSFIEPAHIQMEDEVVTLYPKTVLDGTIDESLFTFTPPQDARLIPEFPDPMDSMGANKTGDPVPALKLKSADGKVIEMASYRGKPVLLDFWATWCAPCVASMPQLAEIYKEGKDKGLVLLSVDRDEEADKATGFMTKKGYTWPNFHDGDGEIEKLMGSSGIPRLMLVDAQGTIVFDTTGSDENKLREHLAKLGPEYADLAPKPKPSPGAEPR
jgi:thiol-disulfide isomerase/thioredoxin